MNQWRQRLASVMEWSATDKGLLPAVFLILINLQYLAWGQYALHRADSVRLINTAVMTELTSLVIWITAGATALLLLGLALRRKLPELLPYQYLTTLYFARALIVCSHYIGSMGLASGVVLLGGPLFGFIVLHRGVVWLSFLMALLLLLVLSFLSASGILPYAPLMKPITDAHSQLFWTGSAWLFAAPHLVVIVLLADQTLNWWRNREDTIRTMSRTDALTGIHNRRSIIELLDKETARTHRHGPPLCAVLLDLDHFKHINDTWGHTTGDHVLREAAALLRHTIRQCDAVGRYGGEEFMILLADTDLAGANALVERCRAHLAGMKITSESGEPISVSASFGLVCNQHYLAASTDLLIKEADDALYRAKAGGRNCVIAYDIHPPSERE